MTPMIYKKKKTTSRNAKAVLLTSLAAALILPFSVISLAEATANENNGKETTGKTMFKSEDSCIYSDVSGQGKFAGKIQ